MTSSDISTRCRPTPSFTGPELRVGERPRQKWILCSKVTVQFLARVATQETTKSFSGRRGPADVDPRAGVKVCPGRTGNRISDGYRAIMTHGAVDAILRRAPCSQRAKQKVSAACRACMQEFSGSRCCTNRRSSDCRYQRCTCIGRRHRYARDSSDLQQQIM